MTYQPIIGELTITTDDGTDLTAPSDLQLAWKWAEYEHGSEWAGMRYTERCASVSLALQELRRAFNAG